MTIREIEALLEEYTESDDEERRYELAKVWTMEYCDPKFTEDVTHGHLVMDTLAADWGVEFPFVQY